MQSEQIQSIRDAIVAAEASLRNSRPKDARLAVIELARSMDLEQLGTREGRPLAESDPDLDWLYVSGYPRALQTFLDESTLQPGYPLQCSTMESQTWAASALQQAGRIELFRLVLSWCREGLATIHGTKDGVAEVQISSGAGIEAVEREDFAWLSTLTARIQQPVMDSLSEKQKHIDEMMAARVYPWREHFIGYTTTPEIDAHFEALGVLYSQHLVGQDSFPATATFGGSDFDVYRAAAAVLIGWSMKHVAFCKQLVRKNPNIDLANVLTTSRRSDDLIRDLGHALDLDEPEAHRALNVLTLTHRNVDTHYTTSAGPAPPLIAIADQFLLLSAYGWQSSPYSFMLAGLRREYPIEWDRGLGLREGMFRSDLYKLFTMRGVLTTPSGCKLRTDGRLITDVDAVVFHRPTKTLGLFQLKWQDLFGGSMRARASRYDNISREVSNWLDAVESWLGPRSNEERIRGLGLDRFGVTDVSSVELFVLGRHFAHFSGGEADDRAAWGLWPQVLRLFEGAISDGAHRTERQDQSRGELIANPLGWLAGELRRDSPSKRIPTGQFEQQHVKLGRVQLLIRAAEPDETDHDA